MEGVASAISLTVGAGLYFPRYASLLGAAYMVGREVFAASYAAGGAEKRKAGAVVLDLSLLGLLGLCVTGAVKHAKLL